VVAANLPRLVPVVEFSWAECMRCYHGVPRLRCVIATALLVLVISGAPHADADQTANTTQPPTEPLAPPVAGESGLGQQQCAPATTTVVSDVPWPQVRLTPQRVWPMSRGAGQVVAVIDSGVDASVAQLANRVLPGFDAIAGKRVANTDCVGHGTFVAGIIAARPVPGIGFAGIAPDARILPVRQTGSGSRGTAVGMATAIRWASDAGAKIINVSAASRYTSPVLAAAVQYAASRDVLIVASVSNDAESGNPKAYPAAYPGVVAVAAVGADGKRASFSETGGYVSVAAPGSNVLSVGPRGNGHLVGNGTSFAAPYVSGVAALVRAAHPNLTAAQVKHRLEATADHPSAALPDPQLGWGVVNPYAAVTGVLPEESGAVAAAPNPRVLPGPVWPSTNRRPTVIAAVIGCIAIMIALFTVWANVLVPQGRRRRWRSADLRRVGSYETSGLLELPIEDATAHSRRTESAGAKCGVGQ
jgi:membrane-anchored mycosin MYCP